MQRTVKWFTEAVTKRYSGIVAAFAIQKLFEPVARVFISEYYQLFDLDGTLEYLGKMG